MPYETDVFINKTRDFLRVEAQKPLPGAARITADYETFQAWMIGKKRFEGHSEKDALRLPTTERLEEMQVWLAAGKPQQWAAP